jgi:adenine-specific DNA-methyltransferase
MGRNNVNIRNEDFLFSDWSVKYDGAICNPPYLRLRGVSRNNILASFRKNSGLKVAGAINLYSLFIIKIIRQMKRYGRAAIVVPTEILSSRHCELVRKLISETGILRHAIIINKEYRIFKNADVTSCLLLLENDSATKVSVFTAVNSVLELVSLKLKSRTSIGKKSSVVTQEKLSSTQNWEDIISGKKKSSNSGQTKGFIPLSEYGHVTRGIATGSNEFFMMSAKKAKEKGIPKRCLLPCVTSRVQFKGDCLTKKIFTNLEDDVPKYLFDAERSRKNQRVINYLRVGVRTGVSETELCRKKKYWFRLERYGPAPILISMFFRKEPKIVRNKANVLCLSPWLRFVPHKKYHNKVDELFEYLSSSQGKKRLIENAKEKGRGLKMLGPRDVAATMVPDFNSV